MLEGTGTQFQTEMPYFHHKSGWGRGRGVGLRKSKGHWKRGLRGYVRV